MDSIQENIVEPSILFAKNSARLIRKCHKPDQKGELILLLLSIRQNPAKKLTIYVISLTRSFLEFQKVAIATAIGTLGMGFIGFLIKLIHVPINNILVGN